MNKYAQEPDEIIDFHGYTTREVEDVLQTLMKSPMPKRMRFIVGKGLHSMDGPVLGDFVKRYLASRNIDFKFAKLKDGGNGALEVQF